MKNEITYDELRDLDNYSIIDIRSESEFNYGSMPNSINIQSCEILNNLPQDKDKTYIIVCARGQFSIGIAEDLQERGFKAFSLKNGYTGWLCEEVKSQMNEEISKKAEQSLHKKFSSSIWSKFCKALDEYQLIKPNDKIAVCISGGKDSMLMAKLFQELHKHTKIPFDVKYLVMDPGYSKENRNILEANAQKLGLPIEIFETNIFESVYNIEKSPCYLCARMRRGYLYNFAKKLGCNKIALGHHYDDVIETILMGMLYGAQIQTMMPKLHSTNHKGMELIRPLYLIREEDIKAWAKYNDLHFLQCACKFTDTCASCKTDPNASERSRTGSKRVEIKNLIQTLKEVNPEVESHIFRSVENVCLDTVIGYKTGNTKYSFLDTYDEKMVEEDE